MKRVYPLLLAVILLILLLPGGAFSSPSNPEDLQVTLVTPPVICQANSFPVVAKVVNNRNAGKVALKRAVWNWGRKQVKSSLTGDLAPGGKANRQVAGLKARSSLSEAEVKTLHTQSDQLRQATRYLRFTITKEMAAELLAKGSIDLTLNLTGERLDDRQATYAAQKVTLKAGRRPQRPPIAPGAHHSDWYFGDTHSHSTYTWDYYFGDGVYTIPELKSLAKTAGYDWLVLSDHAYCLNASKFNDQKNTVTSLSDSGFAFLYGEELSCAELVNGVKAYDTCHYGGILNNNFIPCATDIFRKASSPDSQQGIDYLKQAGGLVKINHPNWGTGAFEAWNFNINTYPYTHGETGMEILNGNWDDTNNGSTTRWVDQRLLKGEKVFPFAGTDTESSNHFGECYDVVYADTLTQSNIKDNLERGHHYVTTGPGLAVWARKSGTATWSWMGDTLSMGSGTAEVYVSANDSYDSLDLYVMKGKTGWTAEEQVDHRVLGPGSNAFTINANVEPGSYLRVYCVEKKDNNYRAYTTPIWFN